jgi:hypothetical protein
MEAADYGMPLPTMGHRTTRATDESAGTVAAARRAAAAAGTMERRYSVDVSRGGPGGVPLRDYVPLSPRTSLQRRTSLQAMDSNYPGVWQPFNG